MQDELLCWLMRAGFPPDIEVTAMERGLGENELWTISSPDGPAFVLRIFPAGAGEAAEREAVAMETAARHGLPVPAVAMRGTVEGRPVLVSDFVPGELAFQVLAAHPDRAEELGRRIGEAFGRLHRVAAPPGLRARADAWIDRGGPALAPIRHLLAAVPDQDRLLHLDFHPRNLLIRDGRVAGIIDWENAMPGPPHMDLGRSRAILRAAALGGLVPPTHRDALDRFEQGLVAGHGEVIGADPCPDLSAAWGWAMTVEDLTRQSARPGVFATPALLARLTAERDALIRSLHAGNAASPR